MFAPRHQSMTGFIFLQSTVLFATSSVVTPPSFVLDAGPSQSLWLNDASGSTVTMRLQGRSLAVDSGIHSFPPAVQWSLLRGPTAVTWSDPVRLNGTVTFSQEGLYAIQLRSNDTSVRGSVCAVSVYPSNHTFGYSSVARNKIFGTNPNLDFQFDSIDWSRLSPPPPFGVHPRVLFGPKVRAFHSKCLYSMCARYRGSTGMRCIGRMN